MWYASMKLLKNFLGQGMGRFMVIPEHLLKCHPYVASSSFDATWVDEEKETYYDVIGVGSDGSDEYDGGEESIQTT